MEKILLFLPEPLGGEPLGAGLLRGPLYFIFSFAIYMIR